MPGHQGRHCDLEVYERVLLIRLHELVCMNEIGKDYICLQECSCVNCELEINECGFQPCLYGTMCQDALEAFVIIH